jgi:phthiodiolone/phenolphthiodiolone dimycocerosates ketoreductase
MRRVKYGPCGHMFDPDLNRAVGQMYEQQGYDFMIWSDQMMLTIPRSLWTPDLAPASEFWDIDTFMDTWPLMTDVAIHTDKIQIGTTVFDSIRRPPANMAQLTATLDHYSKGRFFLGMGAGEIKQFAPYGIERSKPFGHLEESVKIIKLLLDAPDVVNYEGPHWNLRNAVLPLMPYGEKRPPILIAGGPGRAVDIAAKHADGWITYVPTCGSPEWYATEVATARRKAEEAGRDPDAMIFYLLTMNIIDETEEKVEQHTHDRIARWDAAAVIPGPNVYQDWGLGEHPIRPDYSYPTHLLPTEWSREDALKIIDKTPPEVVRRARACGTPKSVADQLQAYIAAVPESNEVWVNVINYTSFLGSGNFGDPADQIDLVLETCNQLRAMNGQPIPVKAPSTVAAG